jgi:hypothetical protein
MPAQKKMNLQAVKMREKKDAKEPTAIFTPHGELDKGTGSRHRVYIRD